MRPALLLAVLAVLAFAAEAAAAPTTFDIATYTPPAGWEAKVGSDAVIYVKNAGNTTCLVSLLKSHDAVGATFAAEYGPSWKTVLTLMGATVVPPPDKPARAKSGDVDFLSGSALTALNGKPVLMMMFLLDGGAKVMPVVALTSTKEALEKVCISGVSSILDDIKLQKTPRAKK